MPMTVSLELFLKPDRVDDVIQLMMEILADTRSYAGCLSVDVVRDQDDQAHVALIERWAQKTDQERYMAWRQETGALGAVLADSTAPPKITYFDELVDV